MSRGWHWRAQAPHDADDWAALFTECFGKPADRAGWTWKYADNPHGAASAYVAVDDASGRVVGAYAYVPRRFRRDGRPVLLMQASDAMTTAEFRRRGIFTGLDDVAADAAGEAGSPWAYAFSGRRSFSGFLSNGWVHLGDLRLWRRPFRSRRVLRRAGRVGSLLRPVAPLLDAGCRRRASRGLARAARGPGGERAWRPLPRFDAAVDALIAAAAPDRGLVGERDAEWLNWRYVDTPQGRQECFALGSAPALDGYLVAEWHGGLGHLVELCAADEPARRALLRAFTAESATRGVDEAWALLPPGDPAEPRLAELGYRARSGGRPFRDVFPFIVRACRADAPAEDRDLGRWRMADGDRDAETISS